MLFANEIDFMGKAKPAAVVSGLLILISLGSLAINSLQFGLDFTSGTSIRLSYSEPVNLAAVNTTLRENGFDDALVVTFGTDRDIRIVLPVNEEVAVTDQATQAIEVGERIAALLQQSSSSQITLQGSDFVSAKAGEELAEQGGLGMLVALALIMVYIAVRFQFKFSVAAVVSLIHDVIITLGVFSVFRLQFDLTVLAALLAVIGYSLNDTIIVADRIRENFRRMRKGTPAEILNTSINQTLSRTLITSGTTLLVVITSLLVGGEAIRGFSIALTVGILVGTYSSIYVASSIILYLKVTREDLLVPIKEGAELDGIP